MNGRLSLQRRRQSLQVKVTRESKRARNPRQQSARHPVLDMPAAAEAASPYVDIPAICVNCRLSCPPTVDAVSPLLTLSLIAARFCHIWTPQKSELAISARIGARLAFVESGTLLLSCGQQLSALGTTFTFLEKQHGRRTWRTINKTKTLGRTKFMLARKGCNTLADTIRRGAITDLVEYEDVLTPN